jgi:hypothetical protein
MRQAMMLKHLEPVQLKLAALNDTGKFSLIAFG